MDQAMPTINYGRGLRRIYGVICSAWIVTTLTMSIQDRPGPPHPTHIVDVDGNPISDLGDVVTSPSTTHAQYWALRSFEIVVPPGAGYIFLFCVLPWIGRGFKADPENSK